MKDEKILESNGESWI